MDSENLCALFWKLAEDYPKEIIVWVEESLQEQVDMEAVKEILHHDLIMTSYAVKTTYLPDTIGYIDQLPFVKVDQHVQYGTWQMSSDMGGIKAETLLRFKPLLESIINFDFLLNSIAKLGQQNGLFCYSAPSLWKNKSKEFTLLKAKAGTTDVFQFVFSHYKCIRTFLLLWHYWKYEKSFPLFSLLKSLTGRKYFQKQVDFSGIEISSTKSCQIQTTVDVIIPTMGRREYLLQVLEDLKYQTLLPKKVIVVEQDQNETSVTALPELESKSWPFEVVHHFIHKTGACNARNMALQEVNADWVFFADDDIRFLPDLLQRSFEEVCRLGLESVTLNCKQGGEETYFKKIKQWGSFGSGTSLVRSTYATRIEFSTDLEFGFGEDQDYGMQLRSIGCDIIYHPELEILHLKAPSGGFRDRTVQPWEREIKPSPTVMTYVKKYYTEKEIKGYRTELFLRYYFRQKIRNPWKYIKVMEDSWKRSEEWVEKLQLSYKN